MTRILLCAALFAGCAVEAPSSPPESPTPLDEIWAASLRVGDLVVLVPGTKAYDYLGGPIGALPGPEPVVPVRTNQNLNDDGIVFEQAIAAAHKAGISNAQLESGALTFGLWGAGFATLRSFVYVSYEDIHLHIEILGGANSCATGTVVANLLNYTTDNAYKDADALYTTLQAWLAAHPTSASDRNVVIASHSWGGAVTEYLATTRPDLVATRGPLGANLPFTIAAGVPAYVPGHAFFGPGFRSVNGTAVYEVDRPDDPVHGMNPSGNGDGHQYDITFGDDFRGAYGLTTMELSCRGVAGACM